MHIMTVSRPVVKATRVSPRSSNRFGFGLLRYLPNHQTVYTAADVAWLAAEEARQEAAHIDAQYDYALACDRTESGLSA
jgi:hypothetical protein